MSTESRKKFKIVMFGDYGYLTYRVGKLSLVNQFINKHPTFMFSRKEFRFTKNVSIDKNDVILEIKIIKNHEINDGFLYQERYSRPLFRCIKFFILVYDITNAKSFDLIRFEKKNHNRDINYVLVGNKADNEI